MPLYFAYGSNLNLCQMMHRCPSAKLEGVGQLNGYSLGFTHYSSGWGGGTADVVPSAANEVWGLVFEIEDIDLQALDDYEGYPTAYVRFQATVEVGNRRLSGAWVYSVKEKREFIPPTSEYLDIIKRAGIHWGFPQSYMERLDGLPNTGAGAVD